MQRQSSTTVEQQKTPSEYVNGKIIGSVINGKYAVMHLIDRGSYGQVYECVDIYDESKPLVIKFQKQS